LNNGGPVKIGPKPHDFYFTGWWSALLLAQVPMTISPFFEKKIIQ
jgi:hypothetical protein